MASHRGRSYPGAASPSRSSRSRSARLLQRSNSRATPYSMMRTASGRAEWPAQLSCRDFVLRGGPARHRERHRREGCCGLRYLASDQHAPIVLAAFDHIIAATATGAARLNQTRRPAAEITSTTDGEASTPVGRVGDVLGTTGQERERNRSEPQDKTSSGVHA